MIYIIIYILQKHPLLIRFKGRHHVSVRMVPCCVKSLNHEDAFVLITADEVYYYIPKFANVIEKSKAKDFATLVCQSGDLGTSAKTPVDAKKNKKFWKIIGEKLGPAEIC